MQRPTQSSRQSELDQSRIAEALNQVLSSEKFQAAPQMSAFLRYVVEQASTGNKNRIKAYTVAVDALGKPDSFDPQNDPVVRVLAGRLRASLAAYYESNPDADLRIQMKPGSYVPVFVSNNPAEQHDRTYPDKQSQEISSYQLIDKATDAATNKSNISTDSKSHETHSQLTSTTKSQADTTSTGVSGTESASTTAPAAEFHDTNASTSQPDNIFVNDKISTPSSAATAEGDKTNSAFKQSSKFNTQQSSDRQGTYFSSLTASLLRFPTVGLVLIIAIVGLVATYQSVFNTQNTTTESFEHNSALNSPSDRSRPKLVSIFVNAMNQGHSLQGQLNTLISGVFSESESLRVYRLLDNNTLTRRWPEDYLLTLDVLSLPEETRISVQLVDAQTGRITHSDTLLLSGNAKQGLSHEELTNIMRFARQLISDDGPLFEDYRAKSESQLPAQE